MIGNAVRRRRGRGDLLFDLVVGTLWGAGGGFVLVLWVLFVNLLSGGAVHRDPDYRAAHLYIVYFFCFAAAGFVGGAIRPWLGTLLGRAFLTFVTAFAFYGGVSAIMTETISGNPIIQGLGIAILATPIWLIVMKLKGVDAELAQLGRSRPVDDSDEPLG